MIIKIIFWALLTSKEIFGLFAGLEKAELLCLAFAAVSIEHNVEYDEEENVASERREAQKEHH